MALKKEVLKANAVLASLTDEQITAIENLSKNDEDSVLGTKIGEIYRGMDSSIATITGVQRDGDEKTYKYLERATKTLKESAEKVTTLQTQINDLTTEKVRLEKAISEGTSDKEAAKQLVQVKAELEQTKSQYLGLKSDYDKATETHKAELFDSKISSDLKLATTGLKFKPDLPKEVTGVMLNTALSKLKTDFKPDYIDDGQGGKRLVFRNKEGAILNNPENQLNPFTAQELLSKELKPILDVTRQQKGGGTGGEGGQGGQVQTIDITGAKTRIEANDIATKSLLQNGLTKGSTEFDAQLTQIWKDNNIASLPEK